jgi:hypothetical protein
MSGAVTRRHSNQTNYQSFNDAILEGMGAVMVFLRDQRVRDDAALTTMIVEIDAGRVSSRICKRSSTSTWCLPPWVSRARSRPSASQASDVDLAPTARAVVR